MTIAILITDRVLLAADDLVQIPRSPRHLHEVLLATTGGSSPERHVDVRRGRGKHDFEAQGSMRIRLCDQAAKDAYG